MIEYRPIMYSLFDYQIDMRNRVYSAWDQEKQNVLMQLPTGGGKTVVFSDILLNHNGPAFAIAHRQELLSQISCSLAENGVHHRIIAPDNIIKWIVSLHIELTGKNYYDSNSWVTVAGVRTLLRRADKFRQLLNQTTLWVIDEAHHILTRNEWGKAVVLFPNAKGLGPTATPGRADGLGLGRHADGVFDELLLGPHPRELINRGFLTDYRVIGALSDIDITGVDKQKDGDLNLKQLAERAHDSHIVGDVVKHYLKWAPGKIGVTFVPDIQTANDIAANFRAHGVPAEAISSKTNPKVRVEFIRRLKRGDLKELVNVDIFGEGFDLPAIEVASFARHTESLALYMQQFGRALRTMEGKEKAIILDHVGNVLRHKLPDIKRNWTLDRREKRAKKDKDLDEIPLKYCLNLECLREYEAIFKSCPYCGYSTPPAERSKPEFVDGDLTELSPNTLAAMRGEIERIDAPASEVYEKLNKYNKGAARGAFKNHMARQESQKLLRESIAWWRGHQNLDDSTSYRKFYLTFGVDVATAQTLGSKDAEKLAIKINKAIDAGINMI